MPYYLRDITGTEQPVIIPKGAEVSKLFSPDGALAAEVQEILDGVEPWGRGEDPIETVRIGQEIGARVVRLAQGETPIWAVNPHHHAKRPGLSPYIALEEGDPRRTTDLITVELSGAPEFPHLVRAYPGDYMPPLPWMSSANRADGGVEACLEFWQTHAFIRLPHEALAVAAQPPDWYNPPYGR